MALGAMAPPAAVHAFTQTIAPDSESVTIHPTAVETPRGVLLVHVGYLALIEQVEIDPAEAGRSWAVVTAVLVTHHNGDHAGALDEVIDLAGATLHAHPRFAPNVDGREDTVESPAGERYTPAPPVDVDLVGDERFRIGAGPMHRYVTPGHTEGHRSVHFPEASLRLAADALTVDEDGLAGPSGEFTLEIDRILDSARRLALLDTEQALCDHGGLVEADSDRIDAIVSAAPSAS
jgi:glyoxylase-like metal-dependent hydrolase (beta-lactamase superfamily II)